MKQKTEIKPGQILSGPQFNEAMRVDPVRPNGSNAWVVGLVGMQSERFRSVTLSRSDLDALTIYETACTFDGDGKLLKIGLLLIFTEYKDRRSRGPRQMDSDIFPETENARQIIRNLARPNIEGLLDIWHKQPSFESPVETGGKSPRPGGLKFAEPRLQRRG